MAKNKKPRSRRTNDKKLAGVERIDAPPEEIARTLFPDCRGDARCKRIQSG